MTSKESEAGNCIFPFGKYKGDPIYIVVVDDPDYLTWFLKNVAEKESQKGNDRHRTFYSKLKSYTSVKSVRDKLGLV